MSIKTNIDAVKLKQSIKKSKEVAIDLLGQIKNISFNLDLEEKKANIELTLK